MWINELRNREFSNYCEYLACSKLKDLGWKVFRPLIDRYVDIVAIKKIEGKTILRTIQVKGSRIENKDISEGESYGFTHEPKDLLHSGEHFFIWVLINNMGEANFFIVPIDEFIKIRGEYLPSSKRREHPSLLMRNEWRYGTDRMHPYFWKNKSDDAYKRRVVKYKNIFSIKSPSWEIEGSVIDNFLNNWGLLDLNRLNCSKKAIKSQEINKNWSSSDKKVMRIWIHNNKKAYQKLAKNKIALIGSKKLDDTGFPERHG